MRGAEEQLSQGGVYPLGGSGCACRHQRGQPSKGRMVQGRGLPGGCSDSVVGHWKCLLG